MQRTRGLQHLHGGGSKGEGRGGGAGVDGGGGWGRGARLCQQTVDARGGGGGGTPLPADRGCGGPIEGVEKPMDVHRAVL